jgi:hypothetical protein
MTTGEFDPDIPVGEPAGYQPADHFNPGSVPTPGPPSMGSFAPKAPVGEPGGYQSGDQFSPAPIPLPTGEFNPQTASVGKRAKEGFGPEPAGLGPRAAARLIDGVLCVIVASIIAPQMPETTADVGRYGSSYSDATTTSLAVEVMHLMNVTLLAMTIGVVSFVYFMVFESALGWTLGKKLLGLSVHASSRPGAPNPGLGQAANRNRFLLLLAIPIPYLNYIFFAISSTIIAVSIFNNTNRRGKHDVRAATEVTKG